MQAQVRKRTYLTIAAHKTEKPNTIRSKAARMMITLTRDNRMDKSRKSTLHTSPKPSSTCLQGRKNNKWSKACTWHAPSSTISFNDTLQLKPSPPKMPTAANKNSTNSEKSTLICATCSKNKNFSIKNKWKKKNNNLKISNNKNFKKSKTNAESWNANSSPPCPPKAKTWQRIKKKFKTSKNNSKNKKINIKKNKKITKYSSKNTKKKIKTSNSGSSISKTNSINNLKPQPKTTSPLIRKNPLPKTTPGLPPQLMTNPKLNPLSKTFLQQKQKWTNRPKHWSKTKKTTKKIKITKRLSHCTSRAKIKSLLQLLQMKT